MTKSTTRQTADVAHVVGRKNLIINGGFDVWQRGVGGWIGGYTADRWGVYGVTNVVQGTPSVFTSSKYGLKIYRNAAGQSTTYHKIEAANSRHLAGKDITVSFDYELIGGGVDKVVVRLYYPNSEDNFDSHTAIGYVEVNAPIHGSRYSATFANLPTNVVNGLRLDIEYITSTTSEVLLTEVQLELGSVATEFEHRSYGEELALCQRYFCHSGGDGVIPSLTASPSTTHTHCLVVDIADSGVPSGAFPVEMRANPTITSGRLYTYNWGLYKNVTAAYATKGGIWRIAHDGGYSTGKPYWYAYIADAEL